MGSIRFFVVYFSKRKNVQALGFSLELRKNLKKLRNVHTQYLADPQFLNLFKHIIGFQFAFQIKALKSNLFKFNCTDIVSPSIEIPLRNTIQKMQQFVFNDSKIYLLNFGSDCCIFCKN